MRYDIERYLNVRTAGSPSWSPDGSKLAYLTNITGVPQVWQVSAAGGYPEQLTYFPERVSSVTYSPKADKLLFAMDSGGNERQQLFALTLDGSDPVNLSANPDAIHNFGGWSPDGKLICFGSNRRHPAFFDLYIQDVETGEARMVLQHDGTNHPINWSSDGRYILFNRPTGLTNNDIYLLEVATGESRNLTPHTGSSAFRQPVWTADCKGVYLRTDHEREFTALVYLDLATGEMRPLVEAEWGVESHALSHDDRLLAYTINQDGYSMLHVKDLQTGENVSLPELPSGVIGSLDWSPVADQLAFTFVNGKHNPDVWTLDISRQLVTRVTHSSRAGIQDDGFVTPELIRFTSFDGRSIPAWLYRPEGASGPLPVVVSIHGGPESQERPGFNPNIQYLVNNGFAVLAPNVRGSTGYGKEYTHLDDVRKRMDSVKDIEFAVKWLKESGVAKPDKIAVMGGSYGGFMVLACITTYPDLWAAAVDTVGIANFETFLRNTGAYRRKLREAEYGSLENDLDFFREISPIYHVDMITAPLMVIHGANDPRVPVGEAEQIVASIKQRGGVVEYLRFENEGHGLVKLPNRLVAYRKVADFLAQHLK